MTLSKKEKTLLIIFGILVYGFIFVKFVLMSSIPKIKDANNRIVSAQIQLDALERDYQNIDTYKNQIKENQVKDERLGEYLMDSAGLSDSIEFVENLALLMGTRLKSISLGNPQQFVEGEAVYYAFPINFSTVLSEEGLDELLKFCEGGSRKVSVNMLNISPTDSKSAEEYGVTSNNKQLFSSSVGIVFYSIDKGAADDLAKFSRAAFERFIENNNLPIFIENLEDISNNTPPIEAQVPNTNNNNNNNFSDEITLANSDFKIYHRGYLYGGYNFETHTAFNKNEWIRSTISCPMNVSLILGKTQYTVECVDGDGHIKSITGNLPDKNFTLYIQSNIKNDVKEDDNLWLNIQIRNDSGKTILTRIEQTGDRVKVMDRDGNEINRRSEREKVYL